MEIENVCVLGSGTIGYQIAQQAAICGYNTRLRDIDEKLVNDGVERIKEGLHTVIFQDNSPTPFSG